MRRLLPLAAIVVVAAPVVVGIFYSAAVALGLAGFGADGATLLRLERVLGEQVVWESVAWSAWAAGASTVLALVAAVLTAAAFRGTSRVQRTARALAILPLPIPHLVAAATAVLVLAQSGLVARLGIATGAIDSVDGMPALVYDGAGIGLILTLAWKEFPFLALLAFTILATRGQALEETARSLGATPTQTFRRVTWPLLWRGLLPGAIAVFVFAFGSYETAVLLAPSDPLALPLLTMERYTDAALGQRGDAFVLALIAFAVAGAAVAAHEVARSAAGLE